MTTQTAASPAAGQLWNDNGRNTRQRIPVRIVSVDATHATVVHELDGETLPGERRIHLSYFNRPGGYNPATRRCPGCGDIHPAEPDGH